MYETCLKGTDGMVNGENESLVEFPPAIIGTTGAPLATRYTHLPARLMPVSPVKRVIAGACLALAIRAGQKIISRAAERIAHDPEPVVQLAVEIVNIQIVLKGDGVTKR